MKFNFTAKSLLVALLLPLYLATGLNAQVIEPPESPDDLQLLPHALNMDDADVDWTGFTFFPFEGAALERIPNPDKSGMNTTDFVLQYIKTAGAQPWGGFFYHLEEPVMVTDGTVFRMKVWSNVADITALLKLEMKQFPDVNTGDLFANVTADGQWLTLEWNLSDLEVDQETPWDRVVIIMDLDVTVTPAGGDRFTWYLDDFVFVDLNASQVIEAPESPDDLQLLPHALNMDNTDVDWAGFTFFPFAGAALERIPNPDKSGLNTTDFVLQYIKVAGADPWGGFFYHLEEPLMVTDATVFKMKVWSNVADVTALLKLEMKQFPDVNTGDLFANVTASGSWLELEWDLSALGVDQETPWDRVVIIMDLDVTVTPGGGDRFTWYLDNFVFEGDATSIDRISSEIPQEMQLKQNYPNPFNPSTTIEFGLADASFTTLEVYNMLGQRVAVLANDQLSAGWHRVNFDASGLSSGTYIYRLQAGDRVETRKLMLIK
jgi:hypothetical protein